MFFLAAVVTLKAYSQTDVSVDNEIGSTSGANDDKPVVINSVRLWHSPDKTRVVFDVSANIEHQIFTLEEPYRLVVDIQNAIHQSEFPRLENNNHVKDIRFGTPKKKVLRYVFGLKRPLEAHGFILTPNELYSHRLVLDLVDKNFDPNSAEYLKNNNQVGLSQSNANIELATIGKEETSEQDKRADVEQQDSAEIETFKQADNKPRTFVVAIDAGHGGVDPGALGNKGSREKVITLAIAKRLKKVIDTDSRMQAILIRTGDYYIDLQKRRLMAREQGADVFVSIHADAFTKSSANGLSVFALSQRGATSAMARALAAKENASDLIGGVSLANKDVVLAKVLVDLSMTNTISESVNLGGRVLKELAKVGRLHSKRVEQASFAVLKSPDMPSILVETGFITNLNEERKLRTASYQKKIANAIYTALGHYYDQTPYYSKASYASPVIASSASNRGNSTSTKIITHKVARGDSLSKIAFKYGMTVKELKRMNNLKRNTAVLGKRLKVRSRSSQVSSSNRSQTDTVRKVAVSDHVVKRGESLSIISAKYNVTINSIKRANGLKSNTVRVGQKLKLPVGAATKVVAKANRKHKVKRGDTLSEIAQRYGVTISALMKQNKMRSKTVFLGQVLTIPN